MAETQFKRGQRGNRWQPVGSARINADGYHARKVRDTGGAAENWVPLHRLLWEECNGAIPDGRLVVFRDGDKNNIVLENLELIDRTTLMSRNTVHNLPKPLAMLVQLKGALMRQINKRASESA